MENKQDKRTRVIATVGVMAALGVVLAYLVRFPIFPQAPYLEYDAADIPILIVGFAFGPFWGLLITFIVAALQAMTVSAQSGIIGFVMHFLSTGLFVLVSSSIYKMNKDRRNAYISIVIGVLCTTAMMIPLNLIFTPMYGTPIEVVKQLMFPVIVPFNLIKNSINALVTCIVYKHIARIFVRFKAK